MREDARDARYAACSEPKAMAGREVSVRTWDPPAGSPELERLYRQLMATPELAAAPEIAFRLLSLVDVDTPFREVTSIVGSDQVLTARLLRLANSAFFAFRGRVTRVSEAVTLLGFSRVRELALTLSVWGRVEAPNLPGRSTRRTLWMHSAVVAAATKALAGTLGSDQGQAYAAGLLHDIGKLVLGFHFGEPYWKLLETSPGCNEALTIEEERRFGCHHGTVGGWLLQLWGLLPTLIAPVALHHAPLLLHQAMDLTNLVSLADRLVSPNDTACSAAPDIFEDLSRFAPGLITLDRWEELRRAIAAEHDAMATLFGA